MTPGWGWPEWAIDSTDQELWDLVERVNHSVQPMLGKRGFLCSEDGCDEQVQRYEGGWWHVNEVIAYGVLEGRPYQQALEEAQKEPSSRTLSLIAAAGKTDDKGEELTQEERVNQALALWEGAPHGVEVWE